ncbi:hypothetical protein [Brevibacillus laterosporus]|uniref:hypothetical protein n=2 Tax=Brevibacillus TaxID=55080 RepID=UPI00055175FB|nr:hypothetical protein [Brevibacillus laterosporus]
MLVTRSMVRKALEDRGDLSDGHESRKSLEVYSTLAITDAQYEYNVVINKLLLCGLFKTQ